MRYELHMKMKNFQYTVVSLISYYLLYSCLFLSLHLCWTLEMYFYNQWKPFYSFFFDFGISPFWFHLLLFVESAFAVNNIRNGATVWGERRVLSNWSFVGMAVLETDFTCLKPSRSPLCREVKVVLVELTRQQKRLIRTTHPVFSCVSFTNLVYIAPLLDFFMRLKAFEKAIDLIFTYLCIVSIK